MEKIMIIGVGWEQLPLVKRAKDMGYYIVATTQWRKDKIPADIVYEIDSRDIDGLEQIYINEKPDAITADECDYSTYAVAYLTEKYKLPGPSLKTLTITNNKYLQRKVLDDKGVTVVKQPAYSLCWNLEQADYAAQRIGYPVIIKPVDNRGSIGVIKVMDQNDMKEAWYQSVINAHSRMCIVEKYINGDTITAEGFYDSKKFNFITVSSKDTYAENKNVAKILYYPGKLSKEQIDTIEKYTKEIVKAYSISFGFTHFEFLIEEGTGDIYFVEAANRGGGVHISNQILQTVTGIDFATNLLSMSTGVTIDIDTINIKNKAIMYFFEPSGELHPEEILKEYDNIMAMHINVCDTEMSANKDDARARTGVVILRGDSHDELCLQGKSIEKNTIQVAEEMGYFSL